MTGQLLNLDARSRPAEQGFTRTRAYEYGQLLSVSELLLLFSQKISEYFVIQRVMGSVSLAGFLHVFSCSAHLGTQSSSWQLQVLGQTVATATFSMHLWLHLRLLQSTTGQRQRAEK